MTTSKVNIVGPRVITRDFDYWAMHIASILLCMDNHKSLKSSPYRLLKPNWSNWSLSEWRGRADRDAFGEMQLYIKNWAMQYLMATVFNQRKDILHDLVEEVVGLFRAPLGTFQADCFVSGEDSIAGSEFLKREHNTRILTAPSRRASISVAAIRYADLCILVQPEGYGNIAIFGEVEGNHGEKLRTLKYWEQEKPNSYHIHFGIGLDHKQKEQISIILVASNRGLKYVVTYATERNVFEDFERAIDAMGMLLYDGPGRLKSLKHRLDYNLNQVFVLLDSMWSEPVKTVIQELQKNTLEFEIDIPVLDTRSEFNRIITPNLVLDTYLTPKNVDEGKT